MNTVMKIEWQAMNIMKIRGQTMNTVMKTNEKAQGKQ